MQNPLSKNPVKSLHIPGGLKNNIQIIFWAGFGFILVLEGLALKSSVSLVLDAQKEALQPVQGQGVRINFKDYDNDILRIQKAGSFTASSNINADPFTGVKSRDATIPDTSTSTLPSASSSASSASSTKTN